jgi:hypothetical protein
MKTILLFGLRRSGNHYIISLLLQSFQNNVHINDVPLEYDNYIKYKDIDTTVKNINNNYTGFKGADCIIISMENKIIDYNELNKFYNIDNLVTIILLRNPYDHLSSVWKVYNKNLVKTNEIINLWQIYAYFFMSDDNLIKILYDKLLTDEKYFIDTLNEIGIFNIEFDKNFVIPFQNSSFNNTEKSKKVYSKLNECNYKDDSQFIKLFENNKIHNLLNKIITKFDIK